MPSYLGPFIYVANFPSRRELRTSCSNCLGQPPVHCSLLANEHFRKILQGLLVNVYNVTDGRYGKNYGATTHKDSSYHRYNDVIFTSYIVPSYFVYVFCIVLKYGTIRETIQHYHVKYTLFLKISYIKYTRVRQKFYPLMFSDFIRNG